MIIEDKRNPQKNQTLFEDLPIGSFFFFDTEKNNLKYLYLKTGFEDIFNLFYNQPDTVIGGKVPVIAVIGKVVLEDAISIISDQS